MVQSSAATEPELAMNHSYLLKENKIISNSHLK